MTKKKLTCTYLSSLSSFFVYLPVKPLKKNQIRKKYFCHFYLLNIVMSIRLALILILLACRKRHCQLFPRTMPAPRSIPETVTELTVENNFVGFAIDISQHSCHQDQQQSSPHDSTCTVAVGEADVRCCCHPSCFGAVKIQLKGQRHQ